MDDKQRQEELQSQIESAIQNGAKLNEIVNHLSSSEDHFHQEFAKRLGGQQIQDETYKMRQAPTQGLETPLLNTAQAGAQTFADLPVEQQIGYGLAGLAGVTGLGLAGYAGKELIRNKIANANENPEFKRQNDIAERKVLLQEKQLEVPQTLSNIEQAKIDVEKARAERIREITRREQELHQQKILNMGKAKAKESSSLPIGSSGELPAEVVNSPGYKAFTQLEEQTGGPITTATDLKMIQQSEQNRLAKEAEAAKAAGATEFTSAPEEKTLIYTHTDSLTPEEKAAETTKQVETKPAPAPISENKTGIPPKFIADIQQQENLSPLFQKHLIQQQELLKDNTQFTNALQKAYESGKIQPSEFFVPGLGNMDKNVFNTLGPEGRRQALEYKGKTAYGEVKGADYNDVVSRNINDYAESLKKEIPVDLTTRESRIAQGLSHEKNYGTLGKTMKIGGVAGLAMTVAELANAKTPQERRSALRGLGDAILPPSMTSTELAPATLPANAYSESKKLGSPFHVFPNQGRGIMPPSAYR